MSSERRPHAVGLVGATAVGVGAIVGGGILVLAGVALRTAGPGAMLAFALNGFIAVLTALSYAELSTSFPESGGAYVYAKKVLSVQAAFVVGWVLWFAYIVAGLLYALGFAAYAVPALVELGLWSGDTDAFTLALAATSIAVLTLTLIRKATGGAEWATWGKVLVFAFLILAGVWVNATSEGSSTASLKPFLPTGGLGLVQAMGFTFIALQGFEVIATIAGEVDNPSRNLPRAMLISLAAALGLYLPLIFVIATAGVPEGGSIGDLASKYPDTIMAVAVGNYLGPMGYWLVVLAAVMSTLSALHANLLAASRVSLTMAQDGTLPPVLTGLHPKRRTPLMALYASALAMLALVFAVPDLASAGAAASLIFLCSFALAHATSILARNRQIKEKQRGYFTPWFPAVPIIGGLACLGLALFQAVAAPAAGVIALVWLGLGVLLYLGLFSARAQTADAFAEASDPTLSRLRGRAPLILVPVANPERAPGLVQIANALVPPKVGRVLLLSVVVKDGRSNREAVDSAQRVLGQAMRATLDAGHEPEALLTVAPAPWNEIARVAKIHRCAGIVLGSPEVNTKSIQALEEVMSSVDCNVTFLSSNTGWDLAKVERIVVPVGGRGGHSELRARLIGSLHRMAPRKLVWMRVLPESATKSEVESARRRLVGLAVHSSPGAPVVIVKRSEDFVRAVVEETRPADLLVLGLRRPSAGRRVFGDIALQMASRSPGATLVISSAS